MFLRRPHIPRREPVIVVNRIYNVADAQTFQWKPANNAYNFVIFVSSHHVIVLKTTEKKLKNLFFKVKWQPHTDAQITPFYFRCFTQNRMANPLEPFH